MSICETCGNEKDYNFALNIGLCNGCIGEKLEQLEVDLAEKDKRIEIIKTNRNDIFDQNCKLEVVIETAIKKLTKEKLELASAKTNNTKLKAENDRLKGKIKIICVGLDSPDFETQIKSMAEFNKGMGGSIDLNRPELAFHHGWQMAMLECGEMLSKP